MAEVLETRELFPVKKRNPVSLVMPAKAGIQRYQSVLWMPAFAGMTTKELVQCFLRTILDASLRWHDVVVSCLALSEGQFGSENNLRYYLGTISLCPIFGLPE